MNQFLSNKIIASIVALALLVGVGVLVSSGDTSSTTRNAALVVATPCTKPGQVTKVSKQSVVCATTNTGSLWYATMKATGKAQGCKSPGEIRQKSDIVWVCGVIKKKKLWQATQPLSALAVEGDLPSTTPATPDAPVIADNAVLADPQIPDDKIVTQVIDTAATQTLAPAVPAALSLRTQPLGGANAVALETQPVVQLLDQRGASISTAGITITAVSGRTDVVLSGNTAVTDATGRATFTTLSLTGKMGDLTLTFTTPGLEGITSDTFVLAAGAATRLVNNTNIGSVVSGQAFDQQPVLHREDSSANVIAVSGVDVIVSSSPPGLSGATTVATNERGSAGFTGLALTQAGATTLTFTSGALRTTTNVTVVAGNYKTVKITTEASQEATNNTEFSRSPVVQLIDAKDNTVTTAGITVTATITQFPDINTDNPATLLRSTATTNDKGVATFTGLGITGLVGSYTLGYTPTNGVTQASEKSTTLSAGVTTQLIVLTAAAGPEGDDARGTWSLTQLPVIGLLDSSNNPVPTSGVTVTATVTGQDPTTAPTTAPTNAEGKATIRVVFDGANADTRKITYSALEVKDLEANITLPKLNTVVSPAWELPAEKTTTSRAFTLEPPTSNRNGAWTYTSSPTTFATVTSAGQVTPTPDAGRTTITATQAATSKYESVQTAADIVIARATPTVTPTTVTPTTVTPTTVTPTTVTPTTTTSTTSPKVYRVGDTGPGGGKVFYVHAGDPFTSTGSDCGSNCRYLEAAPSDHSSTVAWCSIPNKFLDASGTGIGSGMSNTTKARTTCTWGAIQVAADYTTTTKDDWYLPSKDELNELCKYFRNTGQAAGATKICEGGSSFRSGFAADVYWSSSEATGLVAWRQWLGESLINPEKQVNYDKFFPFHVRPVRAFSSTCAAGGTCAVEDPTKPTTPAIPLTCATGGTCKVGSTGPGGGKVFYEHAGDPFTSTGSDCGSNCRYLEAAPSDHSSKVAWCSNTSKLLGVTATGIGSGMSNTTKARTTCTSGAIYVAAEYSSNNKTDWHLPSLTELAQLYAQKTTVGSLTGDYYWSSSEVDANSASYYYLTYGLELNYNKGLMPFYVRLVRAF